MSRYFKPHCVRPQGRDTRVTARLPSPARTLMPAAQACIRTRGCAGARARVAPTRVAPTRGRVGARARVARTRARAHALCAQRHVSVHASHEHEHRHEHEHEHELAVWCNTNKQTQQNSELVVWCEQTRPTTHSIPISMSNTSASNKRQPN